MPVTASVCPIYTGDFNVVSYCLQVHKHANNSVTTMCRLAETRSCRSFPTCLYYIDVRVVNMTFVLTANIDFDTSLVRSVRPVITLFTTSCARTNRWFKNRRQTCVCSRRVLQKTVHAFRLCITQLYDIVRV